MSRILRLATAASLIGCSTASPSATDAGADAGVACTPVNEPAGAEACFQRGCKVLSVGSSTSGARATVCTNKCAMGAGDGCGVGELCARAIADEPTGYCVLACADARCKVPLRCDQVLGGCL